MRSQSPVAAVPRRDRVLISTCIVLITVLAWAYLVHLGRQMASTMEHDTMMAEMGMTMDMPTAADLWFTFSMWVVMMVGMMTPTAAPVLLLFAATRAGRRERGVPLMVPLFGIGYLTVWVGFSAVAALTQGAMHEARMLSPTMAASSPLLSGAILVTAGIYQLTPFKGACLTHCQSPLGFLLGNWRDGASGAFRMGLRHGMYCLGCCWALMCVLFVVGVMNLLWVAALTAVVLLEKIGPAGMIMARIGGTTMIVFGLLFVVGLV